MPSGHTLLSTLYFLPQSKEKLRKKFLRQDLCVNLYEILKIKEK